MEETEMDGWMGVGAEQCFARCSERATSRDSPGHTQPPRSLALDRRSPFYITYSVDL